MLEPPAAGREGGLDINLNFIASLNYEDWRLIGEGASGAHAKVNRWFIIHLLEERKQTDSV